jgi:hypothetical protein
VLVGDGVEDEFVEFDLEGNEDVVRFSRMAQEGFIKA